MGALVGRIRELQVVHGLLSNGRLGPAALLLDGAAGIGKTTLCRAAAVAASEVGFTVLTTAGAAAEVSMAWAGLADLISGIDDAARAGLSALHRDTLKAVEEGLDGPGADERLVATAFRMALEQLSERSPVLAVVDDAHWLDETSKRAIGFALRRLTGPVAVLAAFRSGEPGSNDRSWVHTGDPQTATALTLGPMSIDDLTSVLSTRSPAALRGPTIRRIHEVSAGNPFYALELARFLGEKPEDDGRTLPPTLAALVRDRIGNVDPRTVEVLATIAAALEPTVDLIASATGNTPAALLEILQPLETRGVVVLDGPTIRFAHPLIAAGITCDGDTSLPRAAHGRLAAAVTHPEQRARHLALSSPYRDPETLAALDTAAESAAARGAFSAAAELIGLAIRLGGDDQMRLLRCAEYHFRAGALDEAQEVIEPIIDELPGGVLRAVGLMLLAAVRGYREGLASTIGLFRRAVDEAQELPALRTQARLLLSLATGIGGDMDTCVSEARRARADADDIGLPELRSQALSLWSHVSFMHGLGVDTAALKAALEIEDPRIDAPVMLRPTPVYALNCAWTGRLDEARTLMIEVRQGCEERGTELDVLWATEQLNWIDVAAGRYDDAERWAAQALALARQIGGQLPLITAHTAIAHAAAYRGRVEEARSAAELASARATAVGLNYLAGPPLMSLAFAYVSAGRYEDALQTLKPLIAKFDAEHDIEIMAAAWVPDAVGALVAVGRVDEAEPLVAAVEAAGALRNRPWMLAISARCRAAVLAARGQLNDAACSAERAMGFHEELPMPFEQARTQLLLGQLQRRLRHIRAAQDNVNRAATVFDRIGSPLWGDRAQRELARLRTGSVGAALTDSERQVAEQAMAGLTNRQIAAALFLSEKTVEMHLSNTYRKLGIRSRVQLAERLRSAAAG